MKEKLSKYSTVYNSAVPFPHISLNGIFSNDLLDKVCEEIENFRTNDEYWRNKDNAQSKKKGTSAIEKIGENTENLINYLLGDEFVAQLEQLSGISNLIADKTLKGGGVHYIEKDGYLKIHADFNYHEELKKYRRLNLLLYLNKDWKPEYGGSLELWDKDMKKCVCSYSPEFNTCIIFTTSDHAYHGHPDPLQCPDNMARKSIAVYYYTEEKPEDTTVEYHTTLYKES